MFVRMYTSRLSFQQTALRVPLTHVAMSPLFIFRDLGPISCGILHLSWRTVPTRKGYFPYKSPLNLCNIYQFATDIVTTNTTMRSNTCSFDNKHKKKCELRFIANPPLSHIRQSTTTKHNQNALHFYEGCQKTHCSSASSKFYVSASNIGLLCRACHSLN